ncbi:metallophosphoesterase [Paraflavitalea pollutisoli]|uniref:metallophosphoesterase n=1 Tax=Paraflavitalea pollutisoli TaxID=3034143 RepID=UPI0023EE00DD|nr:metallophosphoesterase [Paraflavitalea sp. H1-2-19X]
MRNAGFTWFLLGLMILLDIYVFQAVKMIAPASPRGRLIVTAVYWLLSVASIAMIVALPYSNSATWPKWIRSYVFAIVIGLFVSKLLASLFIAIDDIRRAGTWAIAKVSGRAAAAPAEGGISRSVFLSWISLAVGGGLFGTLLYGFNNKYKYHVNKLRLSFANLPAAFKGLKIVHISDIHSGSFTDRTAVEKGIKKIMEQKPDLILFTGDLVNDRATEMDDYKEVFAQLKAPLGVYSTLGNHDYGDYVHWESAEAKSANLESLKAVHGAMGWRLLMNEHVALEKDGQHIALLGIENWGAKGNFPKYGKMEEAHAGSGQYPFKILMSHDPSHWEAEVLDKYKDVDLMLAGHTHGMQFGLEVPGFKWSPVQYMYKQWAGLYEMDKQRLYVNRGFGFIGYPGRVGILPEITVLELA